MSKHSITTLMSDVAKEIDRNYVSGSRYYYLRPDIYSRLDRDVFLWAKKNHRFIYSYQGSYPDGEYVHNFLFRGVFVTCAPKDMWPT